MIESIPQHVRDAARVHAYRARAALALWEDAARREDLIREGERLLAELADHPQAARLVQTLFSYGYEQGFDVPRRCAAGASRLKSIAEDLLDPGALWQRIHDLEDLGDRWMDAVCRSLEELPDEPQFAPTRAYFAAQLGDADTALRLLDESPSEGYQPIRRWIEDARGVMP